MQQPTDERPERCRSSLTVRRLAVLVAALAVWFAAGAAQAMAATHYVDQDSRGGPCSDSFDAADATSPQTPWCSLPRAVEAAPDGSVVLVREAAADYADLLVADRRPAERITVKAYPGERPSLNGLDVEGAARWRFEGFRITAQTNVKDLSSSIELVGNEMSPKGVLLLSGDRHLIEDNYIHDLSWDLDAPRKPGDGYGVRVDGSDDPSRARDIIIRGNRFDHIPADGIQFGSVRGALIEGNDFTDIADHMEVGEHSDGIQMYGTSHDVTVRGNVFHDTVRGLIAKGFSYERLVIENNLFVRLQPESLALNIYDAPGVRVVNNTIWSGGPGLRFRDDTEFEAPMTGAIVFNNIIDDFQFSPEHVAYEDYNLIGCSPSRPDPGRCDDEPDPERTYGTHDILGTPKFADQVNFDLAPDSLGVDAGISGIASPVAVDAPSTDRLQRSRFDVPDAPNEGGGLPSYYDIGSQERRPVADPNAPETTITAGPDAVSNSPAATFLFGSSELGSTFECRLDLSVWRSCLPGVSFQNLDPGQHLLEVRSIDVDGNVDETPAEYRWTVDTSPPETTIAKRPPLLTRDTIVKFEFSASQDGSEFECSLDDSPSEACTSPRTYNDLEDGEHTFRVTATDPAGNVDATPDEATWTVDASPPEVAITEPAEGASVDVSSPTLAGTAGTAPGDGETVEVTIVHGGSAVTTLNAQRAASGWSAQPTQDLPDGTYTARAEQRDSAGNVGSSPLRTFTIATPGPHSLLTATPPTETNATTASFAFSSPDGESFQCRLDGAAEWESGCTAPKVYEGLAEGEHVFEVRAVDAAGGIEPTPAEHRWTIESTPPDTTITQGPQGWTTQPNPSFVFEADEPGARFRCKLEYTPSNAPSAIVEPEGDCTSPKSFANLGDPSVTSRSYTLTVTAIDAAGNVEPQPATRFFKVDVRPPSTEVPLDLPGPNGPLSVNRVTVHFSSNTDGDEADFECKLDPAPWGPCQAPASFPRLRSDPPLAEGPYTLRARAKDAAGNVDPTPVFWTWTIDRTAPVVTVTQPTAGASTSDATPVLAGEAGTAPGDSSTIAVKVYAGGAVSGLPVRTLSAMRADDTWSVEVGPELAPGTYTVQAEQADHTHRPAEGLPGNVGKSAARTFTLSSGPETTLTSGPTGLTSDTTPTFEFSSTVSGSSFLCRLDGPGEVAGAEAPCASPKEYATLADGAYKLTVTAVNPAGEPDPTPEARSFIVDATPPSVTIDSRPNDPTNQTTADFAFSSPEGGASFRCKLDGPGPVVRAEEPCSSPKNYTGLADGTYKFTVTAVDLAGNRSSSPAVDTFKVDTDPPETVITSGPPTGIVTTSTTATFSFDFFPANDPSTFECRLDGGTWSAVGCTSPRRLTDLAAGEHRFEVRALDLAGNVDATPEVRTWTIDRTPPATADDVPQDWRKEPVAVTLTATDTGGAGVAKTLYTKGISPADPCGNPGGAVYVESSKPTLQHGEVIRYCSVDNAGNREPSKISLAAKVDGMAPVTSGGDVPGDWQAGPVEITLSATDDGGSGLAKTLYATGAAPADPLGPAGKVYDPAAKPTLQNGERISYASVDHAGNFEEPKTSEAAKVDGAAPVTSDDVPSAWRNGPVVVSLSAVDGQSGIDKTYYTTGVEPADPRTDGIVYVPASKPTLQHGQRIRYYSVDRAGNQEKPKTSEQVKVDATAPVTSDDVPLAARTGPIQVTLSIADGGGSGVARTLYTTGASPADPRIDGRVYDPAERPILADGERIRYASVDNAGNVEEPKTSLAAKVAPPDTDPGPPAEVPGPPPGVPPGPPPGGPPGPPDPRGAATALASDVGITMQQLGASKLARRRGFDVATAAPGRGTIAVRVMAPSARAGPARTRSPSTVAASGRETVVAEARRRAEAAVAMKLKLRLTPVGRRFFDRPGRKSIAIDVQFSPPVGESVSVRRRFLLRRSGR